jgi:hypothetical protein
MININRSGPDFFLIGAPKCASTSIFQFLSEHECVYIHPKKELDFFIDPELYKNGYDYYLKTFFNVPLNYTCGDASVQYLISGEVARRIKNEVPIKSHKFIVTLRNPIDRLYSAYWWDIREGAPEKPFMDVVFNESGRLDELKNRKARWWKYAHVAHGMYGVNLKRWMDIFDESCFLVILDQDIRNKPEEVARKIYEFIGVDSKSVGEVKVVNSSAKAKYPVLQRIVSGDSCVKRFVKKLVPMSLISKLGMLVRRWNSVDFVYPPLDAESRERIYNLYRSDIEILQDMINRDLSHWIPDTLR